MSAAYPTRASLKDIAAVAQTSVATVSRVLNNSGYYSEEIRQRVLKAAEDLNYQPNLRARGLRQQRSQTIGLLIPNLLNAYYTALADDISQLLNNCGCQLLLSSTRDDPQIEQAVFRQMVGHDVDGLIWVPTQGEKKLLDTLISRRIPAVSIVRQVEDNRLDTIVFEDFAGAQAATQHLLQLGHKRIGFIGGEVSHSSNYDRWQGYLKAMESAGLAPDLDLIKLGRLRGAWGSIASDELLRLPASPTALFIASNAIMPGVMKTLRQHEVCIPEDVSLICFDDLDWFTFSRPPISAVSTSHNRLAEAAVDLLLQRVQNPGDLDRPPVFMQINFELLLRASTAAPKCT
jgi:LacI family transcriptional regulator